MLACSNHTLRSGVEPLTGMTNGTGSIMSATLASPICGESMISGGRRRRQSLPSCEGLSVRWDSMGGMRRMVAGVDGWSSLDMTLFVTA